ncbi:PREDICTED: putative E3 ubiquitin-protein ligase RING1b [Camelina sativa]|uniref:E3 ubiquitin-protein ligase RING1b n=1 Tax=Camelina sativa TaxID=90675 RepID=A0ABM0WR72_CAMSA|nr:PREDICTED: putative E3 ubiquitin-protein ligase RING1b [Camelina sativa]
MPALKNLSAADEEYDQLGRNSEADRFNPEANETGGDPEKMDDKDGSGDEEDDVKRDQVEAEDEEALEEDSKERSKSSSGGEQSESDSEYVDIDLADIRRDVQCSICLGIIRKTRTVMECLHRFCQECIDKSMRLGNNECPTCRKHCASRRSLRDDPNFDAFIATLFKDIDKYEEEELAFSQDDETRNKQIQASIARVSQRQSSALAKKKSFGKDVAVFSRSRRSASGSRRRRNCRSMEQDTSEAHDDDDDQNNGGKDSSSDEPCAPQRKRKKRSKTQPSSSAANNNDNCAGNGTEQAHRRDSRGISPGLVWNAEMLAWGRGGTRSNTRQGHNNHQGASSKRNARLNRLVEYLGSLEGNNVELDIPLKLISLDAQCLPDLVQPYLRCRPTLLVKQLCEYVARQMQLKAEEVELLVSKEGDKANGNQTSTEKMQSLKDDETLAMLKVDCISNLGDTIVVYRQKKIG